MAYFPKSLDWSLAQAFVAVAEAGSLSGAARRLERSQPTLGRQIQALEQQLHGPLFTRQASGMALTEAGRALLPAARDMAQAAGRMALAVAGQDAGLAGTVRLTASMFSAQHHLPPVIAQLRRNHPDVQLEIVASNTSENLLFREADIALRMYRPTQLDMVTQHLGDFELGLYAATTYLEARGRPLAPADLSDHDVLGYDRSELILRGMQAAGFAATREDFPVRCDDHAAYFAMIVAGCGLGFAQVSVASKTPGLERLMPGFPLPVLPLWLTAHGSVRHTPRVALVWTSIAQAFAPMLVRPGRPTAPS